MAHTRQAGYQMNSKKETAESVKILNLLGKPTPHTRYSKTANPAILKLLKYYGNDEPQVCRWHSVLKKLGWIDCKSGEFATIVTKTKRAIQSGKVDPADFRDTRTSSYTVLPNGDVVTKAKRGSAKKVQDITEPDAGTLMYDKKLIEDATDAQDEGAIVFMQRELNGYKKRCKDMQAIDYERRQVIQALRSELANCQPDKFNITLNKIVPRFKGKYYNILPLSDVHWGEVVRPEEVNNLNEYNFEISKRRQMELFRQNYEYAKEYGCDELHICMLGDLFSGNIHDELRETNEAPLTKALVMYYSFIVGLIDAYKQFYKTVHIHCVVGNHARGTKKVQFKLKGIDNFEYILYSFLEERYNNSDDNVHVNLGDSTILFARIGEQRWKLEHGDQYKGGSAFVSPLSTVVRDNFKDQSMYSRVGETFDAVIMGHWHIGGVWYLPGTTTPVYLNPSIIGPGEFAAHAIHSGFPASSYTLITDGEHVVDQRLIDLSSIR